MRWMPLRVSVQFFFTVFCTVILHSPLYSVFLLLFLLLWLVNFSKVVTFLSVLTTFSKFWTSFEPAYSHLLCTLFLWLLAVWSEYFYSIESVFQLLVPPFNCLMYPHLAFLLVLSTSLKWFLQINAHWHKLCMCLSLHLREVLSVVLDL